MHKITMVKPGTPIHVHLYCVPKGYEWAELKGGSIHEFCHLYSEAARSFPTAQTQNNHTETLLIAILFGQ